MYGKERVLFISEVGSRMWGMNRPDSDYDKMVIYQVNTKDILSGYKTDPTKPSKSEKGTDYSYMEIGHLISLLCKGNVNAIWTVCSPIHENDTYGVKSELMDIVMLNTSKMAFSSIRGMVMSQVSDIDKRKSVMPPFKAARAAIRTSWFGEVYARGGDIGQFGAIGARVPNEPTLEEVNNAVVDMNTAFENSDLLDAVEDSDYRNFLLKLRMDDIVEDYCSFHSFVE